MGLLRRMFGGAESQAPSSAPPTSCTARAIACSQSKQHHRVPQRVSEGRLPPNAHRCSVQSSLCREFHAALNLVGHEHTYQHFSHLDTSEGTPWQAEASAR